MRAAGLAAGLRAHGFETIVTVPRHRARWAWGASRGSPPIPPGTVVLSYRNLAGLIDTVRPAATVICNSNYVYEIEGAATGALIFDFFAPKYLEARHGGDDDAFLGRLEARKLRALSIADAVILNGAKKGPYARDWLGRSGRSGAEPPLMVVNMCYPWPPARERGGGRGLSVLVAGYYQRWLRYGDMFSQLARLLGEVPDLHLTLLVPRLEQATIDGTPGLGACLGHGRTRVGAPMIFEDYAETVRRHDVFVDLFSRTEERELAMVTRSVVSLGLGVPVVHPDFTEVSGLISEWNAGWIVSGEAGDGLHALLGRLAREPELIEERAAGARALGRGALHPETAVEPLAAFLGGRP
jgi:hypothetical protein